MFCLPVEYLNGWLFGVDVSRIKDAAVRERLTQYQRECFTVLYNYWHSGKAENPRLSTVADRVPLKDAVNLLVARAGISYSDAYRMVHQRFGVAHIDQIAAVINDNIRLNIKCAVEEYGILFLRAAMPRKDMNALLHQCCGNIVLRDRRQLSQDGILIIVVTMDRQTNRVVSGPDIVSRGFVYVRESEALMEEARARVQQALDRCEDENVREWSAIKSNVRDALSRYLFDKTRRRPMILPIIMEI